MRFARSALILAAVIAPSHPTAAQPKAPPTLDAKAILAAESALSAIGCQFDRIKDQKDPLFGQARLVKFPATTTDAALNRLISQLQVLPALTAVDLGGARVTDKSAGKLAKITGLTAIYLDHSEITGETLKALTGLKGLVWLDVGATKVTGADLSTIAQMPRLVHLFAARIGATDEDLAALEPMTELRSLDLSNNAITAAGLKRLTGAKGLTTLRFARPQYPTDKKKTFGDDDVPVIAEFKELEELDLSGTAITNKGFQALTACTKLKVLKLTRTSVSFAGITGMDNLTALTRLEAEITPVDDEGVKVIGQLPALETAYLSATKITGKELVALSACKNLKYLSLNGTVTTDSGLLQLSKSTSLVQVWAIYSRVTPSGKSGLERAVPGCRVILTPGDGAAGGLRIPAGGVAGASGKP
jgi:Leucine-rich repeat (LRR) protein